MKTAFAQCPGEPGKAEPICVRVFASHSFTVFDVVEAAPHERERARRVALVRELRRPAA